LLILQLALIYDECLKWAYVCNVSAGNGVANAKPH